MVLVYSGYNPRAVFAFLRTLEKNDIKYCIVASSKDDTVFLSQYSDKVVFTRSITEIDLDEMLHSVEIAKSLSDDEQILIAPTSEAFNRFFLDHRVVFEEKNCIIPLVNKELYVTISDKQSFVSLCEQHHITVPPVCSITDSSERPVVAKPKKYISSDGSICAPIFINDALELKDFVQNHLADDFIFQEFIVGRSFYLLFYISKNENVYMLSQENLKQQPGGKSILYAKTSDIHKRKDIVEPYINMLLSIGFHGMIMIELRENDENYYMIEANPRFWGPSQLFCDANYNLFECMLFDYGFLQNKPILDEKRDAYYLWSGGFDTEEKGLLGQDVYFRPDTEMIYYREKLERLYEKTSKHSGYQILPNCLRELLNQNGLNISSRYERERFEYISSIVDFKNKSVLDIGGNTGYFTFSVLECGASHVDYYEGNTVHADFVKTASIAVRKNDSISVFDSYYDFETSNKKHDVCLCLNVLHHLGDDFGNVQDMLEAKEKMLSAINHLSLCNDILVFQLGFNWKGIRDKCLFANGTKKEMIDFVTQCFSNWEIISVGVPVREGNIVYKELDDENIARHDELGEFLNRPIFIMRSLHESVGT